MTVALLMHNTLKSAERLWSLARERKIVPLKLNVLAQVPRFVKHPTFPDRESYGN